MTLPRDPGAPLAERFVSPGAYPAHPPAVPGAHPADAAWPPPAGYEPPAPKPNGTGVATAALITGFGSLLTCWIPVLGILIALVGVTLGIVALASRQPRSVAIAAIVLAGVSTVAATVFSGLAIVQFVEGIDDGFAETFSDGGASGGGYVAGKSYDSADFARLDDQEWDTLAADPTGHYGDEVLLFGIIDSYNEESGCSLFLTMGNEMATDEADYDVWAFAYLEPDAAGACSEMDWTLPGEHARFEAVVRGVSTVENIDGTAEDLLTIELIVVNEMASIP